MDSFRPSHNEVEEGIPTFIDVTYSMSTFTDVMPLRTELDAELEQRVENITLLIYDRNGDLEVGPLFYDVNDLERLGANTTLSSGKLSGYNNPIQLTTGRKTFVAIANVGLGHKEVFLSAQDKTGRYKLVEWDSNETEKDYLARVFASDIVRNLSNLDAFVASFSSVSEFTTQRLASLLPMVAYSEAIVSKAHRGSNIQNLVFERIDAKVTVNINPINKGTDASFETTSIIVHNIPTNSYILPHKASNYFSSKLQAPSNYWDSHNSSDTIGFYNARIKSNFFDMNLSGLITSFDGTPNANNLVDGAKVVFYMNENRPVARRRIEQDFKVDPTNLDAAYPLRMKQHKTTDGSPVNGKQYVTNGDWVYTGNYATWVEIQGIYKGHVKAGDSSTPKVNATTRYVVFLGYADGNGLDKLNDYKVERNHHYTYNISILGVNDIKVEAESNDYHVEPRPDTEGTIVEHTNDFTFDCHYDQITYELLPSQFDPNDPTFTFEKAKALSYSVWTPFDMGGEVVTYTRQELQNLYNNRNANTKHFTVPTPKRHDNTWLKFYIENPNEPKGTTYTYTFDNHGNDALLSVEELLYAFAFGKNPLTDQPITKTSKGGIQVTIFADEYFYERTPAVHSQNAGEPDPKLWMRFANQPARWLQLGVIGNSLQVSPDRKSSYFHSYASIQQLSITTLFTRQPDGDFRVWGIENIDETPILDYIGDPSTGSRSLGNYYPSNGWINTWRLMRNVSNDEGKTFNGNYLKLPYIYDIEQYNERFAQFVYGSVYHGGDAGPITLDNPNGRPTLAKGLFAKRRYTNRSKTDTEAFPSLSNSYTPLYSVPKYIRADLVIYTPLIRNRDVNRDGIMQARELKWYIPSVQETALLLIGERVFPNYLRPTNDWWNNGNVPILYTSIAYPGPKNNTSFSNNPYIFMMNSRSLVTKYDFDLSGPKDGRISYPNQPIPNSIRLIRDLGILENSNYSTSYHNWEVGERQKSRSAGMLNKLFFHTNSTKDFYLQFRADHLDNRMVRHEYISGQIPLHDENSPFNMIYRNGFEVARYMVANFNTNKNRNFSPGKVNKVELYYSRFWKDFMKDVYYDHKEQIGPFESPCKNYYQLSDKSDKGTWRLPNAKELRVMAQSLYDWYQDEANEIYTDPTMASVIKATQFVKQNYSDARPLHSSTMYSKGYNPSAAKFPPVEQHGSFTPLYDGGWQMYVLGYTRAVGAPDSRPWIGEPNLGTNYINRYKNNMRSPGYVRCVRDIRDVNKPSRWNPDNE